MDIDEEGIFQLMAEQGDEDAVFMSDFEDQVVEAVQDSPELAAIFVSYQEARARVRERARARGFWPVKGRGKKGLKKGKGAGGGVNTFSMAGKRRSLADRIANSTCRICGQPGHWKRECPQRAEGRKAETINMMVELKKDMGIKQVMEGCLTVSVVLGNMTWAPRVSLECSKANSCPAVGSMESQWWPRAQVSLSDAMSRSIHGTPMWMVSLIRPTVKKSLKFSKLKRSATKPSWTLEPVVLSLDLSAWKV
jgi:hypothetical protein